MSDRCNRPKKSIKYKQINNYSSINTNLQQSKNNISKTKSKINKINDSNTGAHSGQTKYNCPKKEKK